MAATNITSNFKLNLTDFDKIPWGEEQHNNWHIVDALMARFIAVSLVQGAWENALAVTVGNRYIDTDADTIYEVLVAHTTPSTGTFSAARIANSSHWQSVTVEVANKGAYAQGTTYNANDFVVDGGRFGIVAAQYTSDSAQVTTALSYDVDVTGGDILTLLDASALIAATHDTNTVATGGTPTATYTASTNKFDFGLVTGATGSTGPTGASGASNIVLDTTPQLGGFLDANSKFVSLSQGANIASVAGDTNIWVNFDGNTVHITGTNAITDFGTPKSAGDSMWVIFDAAASVVDSATITCVGNTNFQAAANDLAFVYALSTSTFIFIPFPNNGLPLVTTTVAKGGTGATSASAARTALGIVAGASDAEAANIMLNAFRISVNGSLSVQNMADGVVDDFADTTGIDTSNSTNESVSSGSIVNVIDASISFLALSENVTDASTFTFSNAALGAATSDRKIVVALTCARGTGSPVDVTGVTIGGVTATEAIGFNTSEGSFGNIFFANVPTGTTGDIVITNDGNSSGMSCGAYRVVDAAVSAQDTGSSEADPMTDTIAVTKGGVGVACAMSQGSGMGTFAWTGIDDEHYDKQFEGTTYISGASEAFASTDSSLTVTADPSVASHASDLMVCASWAPLSTATVNVTVLSVSVTANAAPSEASLVIQQTDVDSVTLNTDLLGWVTREAGQTFTTDYGTDEKLDISGHTFLNDDRVMVTSSSQDLPAGSNSATVYYVINKTSNDFELSLTSGGSAINITDNGTGTHTARRWVQVTLAVETTLSTGRILTGTATISGLTSGTTMRYALVQANTKKQLINAVALTWS